MFTLPALLMIVIGSGQSIALEMSYHPYPEAVASFGAAVNDDWLYVYGGHIGQTHAHSRDNLSKHFRRLNLASPGKWQELPMQQPMQSPALVSAGESLYRIGGLEARNRSDEPSDLHSTASVERFDPIKQAWFEMPPLPGPRSSHDAVVLGTKIYVFGGWNLQRVTDEAEWLTSNYVLDLNDENPKWKRLADMPFQRRALTVAEQDGVILAIGGLKPDGTFSHRVDLYDPATDSWSIGPNLPGGEQNGFAASAFNVGGRVYVSGRDGDLHRLSAQRDSWELATRLFIPRFFHRLLPRGHDEILIVAGAGQQAHLAHVESIKLPSEANAVRVATWQIDLPITGHLASASSGESAFLLSERGDFYFLDLGDLTLEQRESCPVAFEEMAGTVFERGGRSYSFFVGTAREGAGYKSATYDERRNRWRISDIGGPAMTDFSMAVVDGSVWMVGKSASSRESMASVAVWDREGRADSFSIADTPTRTTATRNAFFVGNTVAFVNQREGEIYGPTELFDPSTKKSSQVGSENEVYRAIVSTSEGHLILFKNPGVNEFRPVSETVNESQQAVSFSVITESEASAGRSIGWCPLKNGGARLTFDANKLHVTYYAVPEPASARR